jgi:hypothetical protein
MNFLQKYFVLFCLTWFLLSCGDDEKKKKTEECVGSCLGDGKVFRFNDDKAIITFDNAAVGEQFLILPFTVGNTDAANSFTDGAGSSTIDFIFPVDSIQKTAASGEAKPAQSGSSQDQTIDISKKLQSYYEKIVWQRWQPDLPANRQGRDFWNLVKEVDRARAHRYLLGSNAFLPNELGQATLEETLMANDPSDWKINPFQASGLNATMSLISGDCPSKGSLYPRPHKDGRVVQDLTVAEVVADDEFCVVYIDSPAQVEKPGIETAIQDVVSRYKEVIYKDEFKNSGEYKFKPHFVIADFQKIQDRPEYLDDYLGGFSGPLSLVVKAPVILLTADLASSGSSVSDALKEEFFGTIPHEMQHAISDYYRVRIPKAKDPNSNGNQEQVMVDEGLAHAMEDIFGYGLVGFGKFAEQYLTGTAFGEDPFLAGDSYARNNEVLPGGSKYQVATFQTYRGAAHAFIYYLMSQKGGVEFKDGTASGGGGLQFLVDLTRSNDISTQNFKRTFNHPSWSWEETVGNFLGALIVDNTKTLSTVAPKYQVQEIFKEATDLQGTKNKTFGMRFNNFSNLPDILALGKDGIGPYKADDGDGNTATIEIYAYQTSPGIYTVKSSDDKIEVILDDGLYNGVGAGVSVVRIK